jgi:hypothetical protein
MALTTSSRMAAQDTVYHESTWGSVVTQLQQNADVNQGLKSAVLDAVATVNESLNPMSNCHKGYIHALICTHPTRIPSLLSKTNKDK